ncbi:lipopolysaccharide biosynthesis protein [Rheinheimera sp.]|uniref:lipopolysaccharide biosynthesis protein n=1 Tax=Rheinheimera sp. TaxID=1869214 RepID=UPI003AF959AF
MLKALFAKNLVRQLSLLISGTVLCQLINYAAMLVILRLYGPAEFGQFGAFNAVLQLLLPLAAFSLPTAIPLAGSRVQSKALVSLSLWLSLAFFTAFLLFLLLEQRYFLAVFSLESIGNWVFLLPLALLLSARLQLVQQSLLKLQQFHLVVRAEVLQAAGINLARILLGCWQNVAAVLMAIAAVASGTNRWLLNRVAGAALRAEWQPLNFQPGRARYWLRLQRTLKQFRAFPLYQTPQLLLNGAAQNVPVLVLASLFGPSTVGFYVLAKTLLELPAMLLSRAIGDLFYSHVTRLYQQQGALDTMLMKATLSLAVLGLVPFGAVILWGPALFGWLFGAEWRQAGDYARWMALWLYFAFVNIPSVKAVMVLQLQHWAIVLNLLTLGLRILALYWVGVVTDNPVLAVAAFALVSSAHCVIFTALALGVSAARARQLQGQLNR